MVLDGVFAVVTLADDVGALVVSGARNSDAQVALPPLRLSPLQSAWCLGNIAADGVEMRDLVLNAGVLDPLLASLSPSQHGPTPTSTSFMRCAGLLASWP